jgi:hypothetical protein
MKYSKAPMEGSGRILLGTILKGENGKRKIVSLKYN